MSSKMPLVSIGLVTYNRGDIIHLAIEQLLAQTYRNIELIISDNHSSDNTREVCVKYAKKDSRVQYICQDENIGMHNNFNFVLKEAVGEFFLWATDDDEWDRTFVEKMVKLLQKYPAAIVATASCTFFSDSTRHDLKFDYPEILRPLDSVSVYMYQAMFITYGVIRTDTLKSSGGFFHYPWPIPDGIGDIIPVFRLLLLGDVAFSQEILWKKRDSGYTFDKFLLLEGLKFNKAVLMRIQRYLKFPFLYTYNFFFMGESVLKSSFSLKDKIALLYLCLKFYSSNISEYCMHLIQGVSAVLKGIIKKTGAVKRL
ncbi:hypothetical protein BH09PAT2_BH09PAT2_02450 [soil metagenome]